MQRRQESRAAALLLTTMLAAACGDGSSDGPPSPAAPQPAITSVSVAPVSGSASSLVPGQILQLSATPRDQSGSQITATVSWSTSAANVATVSSSGLVSAVGPGTATITATAVAGTSTVVGTIAVTVTALPVLTTVAVAGTTTLSVGQTSQLTASPRNESGAAIAATVVWLSTAPTIAAVSASGLVTALAVGTATISALATAGAVNVAGTATITVQPTVATLNSLAITPGLTIMQVGQTQQLSAVALDQSGNPINTTVAWSSSAPGVATITTTGLLTALAVESAVITLRATASGVTLTATRNLTVTPATPVINSVTITSPNSVVTVGQTLQLTASARDQFGTNIGAVFEWSSSNGARAIVSSTGLVTGVSAGEITITVIARSGSNSASNTITLSVQAVPVLASVVVTGGTTVATSSTLQLAATPKDQFGKAIGSATVAWSSSAIGVATVNPTTGLVTGVLAGNANITASATLGSANASSFVTIAVTERFPAAATVNAVGLSFSPSSVDVTVGGTVTWNGLAYHDVTFTTAGVPGGNIAGTSSGSRTFSVPAGAYAYYCSIHGAGMAGTVVVR